MSAESYILAFQSNKTCIRKYINKKKEKVVCGKKLNRFPDRFGTERYCSTCMTKDVVQETLSAEKGEKCKSPNCFNYTKKRFEGQPLRFGEDEFCYRCFHTLIVQRYLEMRRTNDKNEIPYLPIVLKTSKNWLNTPFYDENNIDNFFNRNKGKSKPFTLDMADILPFHLRYMIEIILNGIPMYEANLIIWINQNNGNELEFDLKDKKMLKYACRLIYDKAIKQLISKIKGIYVRDQEVLFVPLKQNIIEDLQAKRKKYLSIEVIDAINKKLLENRMKPSNTKGDYLEKFIKEEIIITDDESNRIQAVDIYERYIIWLRQKGLEDIFGSARNMGKSLKNYTGNWEYKNKSGTIVYVCVKFKDL